MSWAELGKIFFLMIIKSLTTFQRFVTLLFNHEAQSDLMVSLNFTNTFKFLKIRNRYFVLEENLRDFKLDNETL